MNWLLTGILLLSVRSEFWMEQPLDHSDNQSAMFNQRYFIQRHSNGDRLVISINGEGPASGTNDGRDLPMRLANQVDATLITVEHRFYG